MCETCGCNITPGNVHLTRDAEGRDGPVVEVLKNLLDANDREAAHNRAHFDEYGVLAINLMSSPGAGKTALLEATIDALASRYRIAVIEGDLETENDAERIRARGVPALQITTGSACHLDAHLVHRALHGLPLSGLDLLFIENVGNLVCPASFDLGQHHNVDAAVGNRRRRQAKQISGHVSRRGSGRAEQDRPAARTRRFRPAASGAGLACAGPADTPCCTRPHGARPTLRNGCNGSSRRSLHIAASIPPRRRMRRCAVSIRCGRPVPRRWSCSDVSGRANARCRPARR